MTAAVVWLMGHARQIGIVLAVVALVAAGLSYRASLIHDGRLAERADWQQRERERLAAEESIRKSDARQATAMADRADARVRELRTFATHLAMESLDERVPLVSAALPADCPGPVAAAVRDGAAGVDLAGARARGALGNGDHDDGGGSHGLRLTANALRLWKSALAGTDVGAGACNADDPTAAACAADTTVTLAEAWRNHIDNARLCAEDRARFDALIDVIEARQKRAGELAHREP